ncbi:MAG: hypothetical protein H6741_27920 [Alphaproteobacteria bacterium]|nr:hypothetical protein [Alphaproteobacteria bacterium]MCB9796543.1 hypothetical protein [Alphaproteobacteria bacterium]
MRINTGVSFDLMASDGQSHVDLITELMEGHEAGSPVAGDGKAQVVSVHDTLTLFSVGTDGRLYAIREASQEEPVPLSKLPDELRADTGWRQTSLSEGLGDEVHAFRARGDDAGVAMLMATKDDALRGSRVRLCQQLAESPEHNTWLDLGGVAGTTVDTLRFVPRTDKPPRVLAAGRPAGQRLAKAWIAEPGAAEAGWTPFEMPMDFEEILDARPGHARGLGRGLYVLYRDHEGRGLVFVSQDRMTGSVPMIRRIPTPPNPSAFDLLPEPGRQGYSELFVASGGGLWTLDSQEQLPERGGRRVASLEGRSFTDVFAASGARGEVSVYARDEGRQIHYLARRPDQTGTLSWSPLATMYSDAAVVAPVRGGEHRVNALFVLRRADKRCAVLWQDDVETTWQENPVIVRDTKHQVPINGVRSRLRFSLEDDLPRSMADMQLSATSCGYVRVNGVPLYVEQGRSVTVQTDSQGGLTLEMTLDDGAAPPHLTLSAKFLDTQIVIDPMANTFDRMRKQDADAVLAAKTRDGRPLLEGGNRDKGRVEAVLGASREVIKALSMASATPLGLSGASPELLAAQGVRFAPVGVEATSTLDLSGIPDGPMWCLDNRGDQLVLLGPEETADVLASQAEVEVTDFLSWVGDALRTVAESAQALLRATCEKVGQALHFVFTLAEQTIKVVVEKAGQIAQAINTLSKRYLGIDLGKLVDWLGFVFDWGDILKTHEFLRGAVTRTLDAAGREVGALKVKLDSLLGELERRVRELRKLPPELAKLGVGPQHRDARRIGGDGDRGKKINETSRVGQTNPAVGWGIQKLMEGLGGLLSGFGVPQKLMEALKRLIDGVLHKVLPELREGFEDVFKSLGEALQEPGATFGSVFEAVGPALLQRFLAQARNVLGVLLDLLADLLDAAAEGLTVSKIEIPLISALYRLITRGKELTLIDLILLPVAIPTTIVAKLLRGRAPFEGVSLPAKLPLGIPLDMETAASSPIPEAVRTELSIWMAGVAGFFVSMLGRRVSIASAAMDVGVELTGKEKTIVKIVGHTCQWIQIAFSFPIVTYTGAKGAEEVLTWITWGLGVLDGLVQLLIVATRDTLKKGADLLEWAVSAIGLVINVLMETALTIVRIPNATKPEDHLNNASFYAQLMLDWVSSTCFLALPALKPEPRAQMAFFVAGTGLAQAAELVQLVRVVVSAVAHYRHVPV